LDTRANTSLLALALALATILALTLWPLSGASYDGFSTCLTCGDGIARDAVLNVLLFLPLGAALALVGVGIRGAVAASLAVSVVVEVLQWGIVPGREAAVTDLLTNTVGGGLGALLMANRHRLASPGGRDARALVCAAGALWTILIGFATWGLAPDAPATPQYWGQHVHDLPGFALLNARVIQARINGYDLPDAPIAATAALRRSIREKGYRLGATVSALPSVDGRAEIVALVDGANHFLALLEQRRCALRFSTRMRGARVGLVPPSVALVGACADGVTRVSGSFDRRQVIVSIERGGVTRWHSQRITPATGWLLVVPDVAPDGLDWAWTLAWLGVPIALIGWWARNTVASYPWQRWIALSAWGCVVLAGAAIIGKVALPTFADCAIVSFAAAATLISTARRSVRPR
jgi:hypothetical protein